MPDLEGVGDDRMHAKTSSYASFHPPLPFPYHPTPKFPLKQEQRE